MNKLKKQAQTLSGLSGILGNSSRIEKLIMQDIGDDDIARMIKGVLVKPYHELAAYRNIQHLFHSHDLSHNEPVILLYEQMRNVGHFTCIQLRLHKGETYLEYFDPLGFPIDGLLTFWHKKVPRYLSKLIEASNLPIVSNKIAPQSREVNTCGRHCVTRLKHNDLPLSEYLTFLMPQKPNPDYFVTAYTDRLEFKPKMSGGGIFSKRRRRKKQKVQVMNEIITSPVYAKGDGIGPPKVVGRLGPAWTRGLIEKPAGTKNMGSWTALVYNPEQQARLGVDEQGKSVKGLGVKGGALGPAWTRGLIEKPAGTKNMGSWTAAVYTPEQQARLGVDKYGKKVADATGIIDHLNRQSKIKGGALEKAKAKTKKKKSLAQREKIIDHEADVTSLEFMKKVFTDVDVVSKGIEEKRDPVKVVEQVLSEDELAVVAGKSDDQILQLYKDVQKEIVDLITDLTEVDEYIEKLRMVIKNSELDSVELKTSKELLKEALKRKKEIVDEQKWFYERPETRAAIGRAFLDLGYGAANIFGYVFNKGIDLAGKQGEAMINAQSASAQGIMAGATGLTTIAGGLLAGVLAPKVAAAGAGVYILQSAISYYSSTPFKSNVFSSVKDYFTGSGEPAAV